MHTTDTLLVHNVYYQVYYVTRHTACIRVCAYGGQLFK